MEFYKVINLIFSFKEILNQKERVSHIPTVILMKSLMLDGFCTLSKIYICQMMLK